VPSKSVEAPLELPTTLILAPGIDCLLLSVTEPVTIFCEKVNPLINNIISKYALIFSFLVSLYSQNTNNFDINKKTLKKINIYHILIVYLNYSTGRFIKFKSRKVCDWNKIVCIHNNFKKKTAFILKIQ
jgi:hypothetical protein